VRRRRSSGFANNGLRKDLDLSDGETSAAVEVKKRGSTAKRASRSGVSKAPPDNDGDALSDISVDSLREGEQQESLDNPPVAPGSGDFPDVLMAASKDELSRRTWGEDENSRHSSDSYSDDFSKEKNDADSAASSEVGASRRSSAQSRRSSAQSSAAASQRGTMALASKFADADGTVWLRMWAKKLRKMRKNAGVKRDVHLAMAGRLTPLVPADRSFISTADNLRCATPSSSMMDSRTSSRMSNNTVVGLGEDSASVVHYLQARSMYQRPVWEELFD